MSVHKGYLNSKTREILVDEYINQNLSISEIARRDAVTTTIVRKALTKYNIPRKQKGKETTKDNSSSSKRPLKNNKETAKKLIEQGMSVADVAKTIGTTKTTIYSLIKEMAATSAFSFEKKIPFYDTITRDVLQSLYANKSTYEIAEILNVDVQAVLYALNHHKIDVLAPDKRVQKARNISADVYEKIDSPEWLLRNRNRRKFIVLEELGIPDSTLNYFLRKHSISFKRFYKSKAEHDVCEYIESLNIPNIKTNDRTVLNNRKEIDLVINSRNVAIELNGEFFHSMSNRRITKEYHKEKSEALFKKGLALYHLWYNDWRNSTQAVKNELNIILKSAVKDNIEQTNLKVVKLDTKHHKIIEEFASNYSSKRLYGKGDAYGVYDRNILIAVFIKDINTITQWIQKAFVPSSVIGYVAQEINAQEIVLNPAFYNSFVRVLVSQGFHLSRWTSPRLFKATSRDTFHLLDNTYETESNVYDVYDEGSMVFSLNLNEW